MQYSFVAGIILTLLLCFIAPAMRRVAITFALIWCVQTAFVLVSGIYDPWWLFAVTNLAGAFVVMRHPADRAQAVIGSGLIFQTLVDIGYGLAGNGKALVSYLEYQTNIGWLIMLLMVVWYGGNFVRGLRSNRGLHSRENGLSGVE